MKLLEGFKWDKGYPEFCYLSDSNNVDWGCYAASQRKMYVRKYDDRGWETYPIPAHFTTRQIRKEVKRLVYEQLILAF